MSSDAESYPPSDWVLHIIYMFVFVLAIVFNTIILNIIHRKQLTTTTFKLIANQTVAEILYSVLVLSNNFFCWTYPVYYSPILSVQCWLLGSVRNATLYVSTFSMVVIAYDRYRKLHRLLSKELNTQLWIVFTWVVAIALSITNNINRGCILLFGAHLMYTCKIIIKSDWPMFVRGYNHTLVFVLSNVIPLLVTVVLYIKVIRKVRERKLIGNSLSNDKMKKLAKTKRNTTEMLIALCVWYFIITFPVCIIMFVRSFVVKMDEQMICKEDAKPPMEAYFIAGIFILGSILVNPFIILYYNPDFRLEIYRMFQFKSKSQNESISLETT